MNSRTHPSAQARWLLVFIWSLSVTPLFAQGSAADYQRAQQLGSKFNNTIFRAAINPTWIGNDEKLYYRVTTAPGKTEFVLVDTKTGKKETFASQEKLIESLKPEERPKVEDSSQSDAVPRRSRRTGDETFVRFRNRSKESLKLFWFDTNGQRQAYGSIEAGKDHEQHTFAGHVWQIENEQGEVLALIEAREGGRTINLDGKPLPVARTGGRALPNNQRGPRQTFSNSRSADGKWESFVKDHNVWVRNLSSKEETQLSTTGTADDPFQSTFYWSPDSQFLVVLQTKPAQEHKVYIVESSPRRQLQPNLITMNYLKPGDQIAQPRPRLFDVAKKKSINVSEELFSNPWSIDQIRWDADSKRFTFRYNQRGHQILRVVGVSTDGQAKTIIEDSSKTFIDYSSKSYFQWLDEGRSILWMSERDGWNHLYLFDAATGALRTQLTKGPWLVRSIERVDEEAKQVWFWALGIYPEQDPYYQHLCRVNFDGSGLTILTEGDGTHQVSFSPSRQFFIDTWSRIDQPPINELRNTQTGKQVCLLEKADATKLLETGWQLPERFVAKGRDGTTDIYGMIIKPTNFDPKKKYPVIEEIYAGPQGAFVPKSWSTHLRKVQLAELGFVVVQIDGMGTNWRSKAFHDVCWKNLADAGFPDRIVWLKEAAKTRPWMDLSRVGIFGGSAGGQNALAGLLKHGDFYKVGMADCGCHDNRMDKIWWNEQWMGWPVDDSYKNNSNVTLAPNLKGKLLLVVGEVDRNVDPASTMQVVDALVRADKDFELLVMPGVGHGATGHPYALRRMKDFFVRHLLQVEPRHTGEPQ